MARVFAQPTAYAPNGTYIGIDSPAEYEQDFFLGVSYAKPPVGDLRFRKPQPLDECWSNSREVKEYGPAY